MSGPYGNRLLVQARIARGIHTQEEFVEAFESMAVELGTRLSVSVRQVRRWESRAPGWPHPGARSVLQALLQCPIEQLGFARPIKGVKPSPSPTEAHDDPVRRREFMAGSLAAITAVSVPATPEDLLDYVTTDPMDPLRNALTGTIALTAEPRSPDALFKATAAAKRHIQACRYAQLTRTLPSLLIELQTRHEHDREQRQIDVAAANAYHVAASLLLKSNDPASAWIAAEKAMTAARRAESAAAFATASRILAHAIASVGHHRQAIRVVTHAADQLSGGINRNDPDRVSVFGSLLLRGAWAASTAGDRDTAEALLEDADRAAELINGSSGNRQWTAFEASNVTLHRVSIALTLSDAGRALDEARKVNVGTLAVAERRAVYWTDVARALYGCGHTQKATAALLAAECEAPEEVQSRPVVRNLIGELLMRDRGGRVPVLRSLAARAQVVV